MSKKTVVFTIKVEVTVPDLDESPEAIDDAIDEALDRDEIQPAIKKAIDTAAKRRFLGTVTNVWNEGWGDEDDEDDGDDDLGDEDDDE